MSEIETSGGETCASLRCFRYGELVQHTTDCKKVDVIEAVLFLKPKIVWVRDSYPSVKLGCL